MNVTGRPSNWHRSAFTHLILCVRLLYQFVDNWKLGCISMALEFLPHLGSNRWYPDVEGV